MRTKSMILIVIALGCGLVASIGISQVMDRNTTESEAKVETAAVFVAITDLDINERLTAQNVQSEEWPKDKVPPNAISNLDDIKDKFARSRLHKGEVITQRRLTDNMVTKSIDIPQGFRVYSLRVSMEKAVSYLIQPGDHVDIVGTFRAGRDVPRTVTKIVLRDVRIFAVNSETEKELDAHGKPIIAKTVSVLLKEDQVTPLAMAGDLASLKLSLRNPEESGDSVQDFAVTLQDLMSGTRVQRATQQRTKPPGESTVAKVGKAFASLLENASKNVPAGSVSVPVAAPAPEPEWQMTVLSSQGTPTRFVWHDTTKMPLEVSVNDEPTGTQMPRLPTLPPSRFQPPTLSPPPAVELKPRADEETEEPEEEKPVLIEPVLQPAD